MEIIVSVRSSALYVSYWCVACARAPAFSKHEFHEKHMKRVCLKSKKKSNNRDLNHYSVVVNGHTHVMQYRYIHMLQLESENMTERMNTV